MKKGFYKRWLETLGLNLPVCPTSCPSLLLAPTPSPRRPAFPPNPHLPLPYRVAPYRPPDPPSPQCACHGAPRPPLHAAEVVLRHSSRPKRQVPALGQLVVHGGRRQTRTPKRHLWPDLPYIRQRPWRKREAALRGRMVHFPSRGGRGAGEKAPKCMCS